MHLEWMKNATLTLALVLHRHSVKSPVGLSYHEMIVFAWWIQLTFHYITCLSNASHVTYIQESSTRL